MIVRILPGAEAELEAIGDYIARDNQRRALSFVRELRHKCMSLADTPPLLPARASLRRSWRAASCSRQLPNLLPCHRAARAHRRHSCAA